MGHNHPATACRSRRDRDPGPVRAAAILGRAGNDPRHQLTIRLVQPQAIQIRIPAPSSRVRRADAATHVRLRPGAFVVHPSCPWREITCLALAHPRQWACPDLAERRMSASGRAEPESGCQSGQKGDTPDPRRPQNATLLKTLLSRATRRSVTPKPGSSRTGICPCLTSGSTGFSITSTWPGILAQ